MGWFGIGNSKSQGGPSRATRELWRALEAEDLPALREACERGASLYERQHSHSPLEVAISWDQPDCVAALIEAGADVDLPNRADSDRTPVMRAAASGRGECLAMLIEAGADVDATTRTGMTACMMAALHGRADCLMALMAAGADALGADDQGQTAISLSESCHPEVAGMIKPLELSRDEAALLRAEIQSSERGGILAKSSTPRI